MEDNVAGSEKSTIPYGFHHALFWRFASTRMLMQLTSGSKAEDPVIRSALNLLDEQEKIIKRDTRALTHAASEQQLPSYR